MNRATFDDCKAIEQTINTYITGIMTGGEKGAEICRRAFHEEAQFWGQGLDGRMMKGPVEEQYKALLSMNPASDKKVRMDILDAAENMALVRVEIEKILPYESEYYTDFHQLRKVSREWKIVTSLFVEHNAEPVPGAGFHDLREIRDALENDCSESRIIDIFDVAESIACVRISTRTTRAEKKSDATDYCCMMKIDSKWTSMRSPAVQS